MSIDKNTDLDAYYDGKNDGYMGHEPRQDNESYLMGHHDGMVAWDDEQSATYGAAYDDYNQGYEWDAVSQGMYDDDPNPYAGTY